MDSYDLSPADLELFEVARKVLERRYDPVIHQVAAALRTDRGQVHSGLHIGSRRLNVCAESSAIANARMDRVALVDTIVAVCRDSDGRTIVTNPCGFCRELLGTYGPDARVIVDLHGRVRKVDAKALMPHPWLLPGETDGRVADPEVGSSP